MKKKMMIVGDYMWDWYQKDTGNILRNLGLDVYDFKLFDYYWEWKSNKAEPNFKSFFHRIQYGLKIGPLSSKINKKLLQEVKEKQPNYIWFYNSTQIFPSTLKKLKLINPKLILMQYANDNPFSPGAKKRLWYNYIKGIKFYDIHLSYRNSNILDYKNKNCKNVYVLKSYFDPDKHFEIKKNIPSKYLSDIVFAGHYEDDGRADALELILQKGYKLKLFGGGWNNIYEKLGSKSLLKKLYPINPASGKKYQYAICGSKIALCFLSKLNNDEYTRRNFEIPAMKKTVLSEYSNELARMFEEDKEIVFFKNNDDMLKKIKFLIQNEKANKKIAIAGFDNVYKNGHDIKSRMKELINIIDRYEKEHNLK
mgnify:CR=1 FL=1